MLGILVLVMFLVVVLSSGVAPESPEPRQNKEPDAPGSGSASVVKPRILEMS